jgi:hypothetical protein
LLPVPSHYGRLAATILLPPTKSTQPTINISARHWSATNVTDGLQADNTSAELSAHADVRDVSSAIARACASALTSAATNRMYAFHSLIGSIPPY